MNDNKELHMCAVISESYFRIYEKIFSRALPSEFNNMHLLHVRDCNSLPGYVAERNFKIINYRKLEFIAKQLMLHEGDNLLVLDLDVVCFRDFKDEINNLLKDNDMLFQHNPHYETMPYCVGVWALQCSKKNMKFFADEVMPRAEALLYSEDNWLASDSLSGFSLKGAWVPSCWQHTLNGKPEHFGGDQCVINAAILETKMGNELNVSLLPDTYTQDPDGGSNPEKCVLYHATGADIGIEQKARRIMDAYEKIKEKIEH